MILARYTVKSTISGMWKITIIALFLLVLGVYGVYDEGGTDRQTSLSLILVISSILFLLFSWLPIIISAKRGRATVILENNTITISKFSTKYIDVSSILSIECERKHNTVNINLASGDVITVHGHAMEVYCELFPIDVNLIH